jgi:hypothetical protein
VRPECIGCRKPIHDHQVRLTLSRDAGGGGRHTKSIHVHETCMDIYHNVRSYYAMEAAAKKL